MISKTIAELWVKLGIDTAGFDESVTHARTQLGQIGETLQKLAVPVAAFAASSYLAIEKFGGMAQGLKDLSYQTGISTTDLQHLQYAATISGTSFSSVEISLNKLTLSMAESGDKSTRAYKAFMGLGVDPSGKTPQQVFNETAIALVGMEDETKRNALAMDIYGMKWRDLMPLMQTYIEKADEINNSPIWTDEDIRRLDEAKVRIDRLTGAITIYSGALLGFVEDSFIAPYENKSFTAMARAYSKLFMGDVQGFVDEAGAYQNNLAQREIDAAIKRAQDPKNVLPGYTTPGEAAPTAEELKARQKEIAETFANAVTLQGVTGGDAKAMEFIKNVTPEEFITLDGATQSRMVAMGYNPYKSGSGGTANIPGSTYLGPSVGTLDPLYAALRGSSGVSSSVMGEMRNYETAIAAWRLNQANTVNLGMYAGGSFGGGEGGIGSTDVNGMRYSDIARWKALFSQELIRVAAVETQKQKDYLKAFAAGGDVYNIFTNDPLAAASAISRQQAANANRRGVK